MPRPNPADLGLLLLAAAVAAGAVHVVTHTPAPPRPVAVHASPTASPSGVPTVKETAEPAGTPEAAATEGLLLVGADLEAYGDGLGSSWRVQTVEAGDAALIADGALDAVDPAPVAVLVEVPAGTRTTDRVHAAVAQVNAAFPRAVVVLVGPFDPAATRTTSAVREAASTEGAEFLDPVERGWTAMDAAQVAEDLTTQVREALPRT